MKEKNDYDIYVGYGSNRFKIGTLILGKDGYTISMKHKDKTVNITQEELNGIINNQIAKLSCRLAS